MFRRQQGPGAKILIVDDELVVRDSLGKWFASEGYIARPAGGARERAGTHPAEWNSISLLIDIKMPGMDGMELQARLHEADPELDRRHHDRLRLRSETAVQALQARPRTITSPNRWTRTSCRIWSPMLWSTSAPPRSGALLRENCRRFFPARS